MSDTVQELAVMVARSRNGETKAFPVVETIHKDNICHTTEAPARVPHETLLKAQQVAQQAVECLKGAIRLSGCDITRRLVRGLSWKPSLCYAANI